MCVTLHITHADPVKVLTQYESPWELQSCLQQVGYASQAFSMQYRSRVSLRHGHSWPLTARSKFRGCADARRQKARRQKGARRHWASIHSDLGRRGVWLQACFQFLPIALALHEHSLSHGSANKSTGQQHKGQEAFALHHSKSRRGCVMRRIFVSCVMRLDETVIVSFHRGRAFFGPAGFRVYDIQQLEMSRLAETS